LKLLTEQHIPIDDWGNMPVLIRDDAATEYSKFMISFPSSSSTCSPAAKLALQLVMRNIRNKHVYEALGS
jgi:hypothetical protein